MPIFCDNKAMILSKLTQWAEALHYQRLSGYQKWLIPFLVPLFCLASLFYFLLTTIRNFLYDWNLLPTWISPVPVISIGNLTTGGTGKTPITIALAKYLASKDKRVIILSRGYKAKTQQPYTLATSPRFGDEAFLMQQAVPEAFVIVGKNRKNNAQKAISDYQPDIILLEDGFQHRGIARNLDLVLIDGERRFGNGHLLPLGPLRESKNSLKRASLLCFTRYEGVPSFSCKDLNLTSCTSKLEPEGWIALNSTKSLSNQALLPLDFLKNKACISLCGIANPEQWEKTLSNLDLTPFKSLHLADHGDFNQTLVQELQALISHKPELYLVMTEKDAVKASQSLPQEVLNKSYALKINFSLPFEMTEAVDSLLLKKKKPGERILVIRHRFIGDTVLLVPFLRRLRAIHPDSIIDVLVSSGSGELLEACPYIDSLIYMDKKSAPTRENGLQVKSFWQAVQLLRQRQYQRAYVLKRSWTSALLAVFSGIKQRIGFATEGRSFLLTDAKTYSDKLHERDAFLSVLSAHQDLSISTQLELWLDEPSESWLIESFSPYNNTFNVLIVGVSTNQHKQWPLQHWVNLLDSLVKASPQRNWRFHFLGTKSDRAWIEKLFSQLNPLTKAICVDWTGQTTLLQSSAIISKMNLSIGVDSGPMHIAAAWQVPTISLFGPMSPQKWQPLSNKSKVIHLHLPCQPCHLAKPCGYNTACMKDLPVEQVETTTQQALIEWGF